MHRAVVRVWSPPFPKDLNAVIDLTGAFGGGATAFVFPCIAYMNCWRPKEAGEDAPYTVYTAVVSRALPSKAVVSRAPHHRVLWARVLLDYVDYVDCVDYVGVRSASAGWGARAAMRT